MAIIIFVLCVLSSAFCAVMLCRQWRRMSNPLIFWSALAFLAFTLSNAILVLDLVFLPQIDLRPLRSSVTLLAVLLQLFGLIRTRA